jgi:hypothetical protein
MTYDFVDSFPLFFRIFTTAFFFCTTLYIVLGLVFAGWGHIRRAFDSGQP